MIDMLGDNIITTFKHKAALVNQLRGKSNRHTVPHDRSLLLSHEKALERQSRTAYLLIPAQLFIRWRLVLCIEFTGVMLCERF